MEDNQMKREENQHIQNQVASHMSKNDIKIHTI